MRGPGQPGGQGSPEDVIKTQITGHNLQRESESRVRVIIFPASAHESKQCRRQIAAESERQESGKRGARRSDKGMTER